MSLDLGLRGAIVGLSLLIAGVGLRDRRDSTVACLGAALAIGAAASAINSAPTFPRPFEWWEPFVPAVAGGNSVVFWLWARAAFDDDFVLRPWHGVLWAAIAGLQLFVAGWPTGPALGLAIDRTLSLVYLGLALLAAAQTLATWPADLVAERRRLRLVVLIGASAYIAIETLVNFPPRLGFPAFPWRASPALSSCSCWWVSAHGISSRRPGRKKAPSFSRRQAMSAAIRAPRHWAERTSLVKSSRRCCAGWST
jgi:hypothetical protein